MIGRAGAATLARAKEPAATTPRRRGRAAVAVSVLAVATAVGWALVSARSEDPGEPQTPRAAVTTPEASAQDGTSTALRWEPLAGIALPISTDGPLCVDAGRASCFTHTDAGAALAAVNVLVRTFPFVGSDVFGPTIDEQVVGDGRDALRRLTSEAYDALLPAAGVDRGQPIGSDGGWVAGYRLDQGQPTAGVRRVDVLMRQSGNDEATFAEYDVELEWRSGDWKLVAPQWGDWRDNAHAVNAPDPKTYTSYDALGGR